MADNRDGRTERHQLRPDGDSEDDQVENLDHAKIIVCTVGDKDGANVEENGFGEIDQRTRDTVCATLDPSAADTCPESRVRRVVEALLEDVLEAHRANAADVRDRLQMVSSAFASLLSGRL